MVMANFTLLAVDNGFSWNSTNPFLNSTKSLSVAFCWPLRLQILPCGILLVVDGQLFVKMLAWQTLPLVFVCSQPIVDRQLICLQFSGDTFTFSHGQTFSRKLEKGALLPAHVVLTHVTFHRLLHWNRKTLQSWVHMT